jgi:hypothetical protein
MKIKFGKFEEKIVGKHVGSEDVDSIEPIKDKITKVFEPLKVDNYDSVFVAYPHQCYSEPYEPELHSAKTLEMYIFSIPEEITATPANNSILKLSGVNYEFRDGCDAYIKPASIPVGYTTLEDDDGKEMALAKGNKVWLLYDVFHPSSRSTYQNFMNYLMDNVLCPPSQEELEKRVAAKISELAMSRRNQMIKDSEAKAKALEADAQVTQRRLTDLIRNISQETEFIETAKAMKSVDASKVFSSIKGMKFVERMYIEKGVVTVDTEPISIGPFNFGKWKISLNFEGVPRYKHENTGNVCHPYEYDPARYGSDHLHDWCLGGFAESYAKAMSTGKLDEALLIARMEITNYSTSTKMQFIEPFLKKIDSKSYNKEIEKIKAEKFSEGVDEVRISDIKGSEVTFIGMKGTGESGRPTAERTVIKYAK